MDRPDGFAADLPSVRQVLCQDEMHGRTGKPDAPFLCAGLGIYLRKQN